jgi:4-amino-4-deoxy-L-arabinose transferase-like glycosyltransferase
MTTTEREKATGGSTPHSFRTLLSAYRTPILLILLIAFAWRLALVIGFPHAAFDEIRYTAPAVNMLAGRGFSSDVSEPILPSDHTVPVYPLFIAAIYSVFGRHNLAVRVAQSVIDLLTCLLVAFVSFSLAPPSLKKSAAISALIIYGCLSWFTVFWTRYILTETLAIFLTMLAVTVSVMALRAKRWRWPAVGLICGVALLTRADSVLLVLAFGLFLSFQIVRLRSAKSFMSLLLFCSTIPVVLAPWIVRNYIAFGKFQPLASEYGRPRGEYVPTGYLWWIRTWMTDESNYHAGDLLFFPGSRAFDPSQLPSDLFDSAGEREEVRRLIATYNQSGEMTPELSDRFRALANERIRRAPLRFYLWLPLKRVASMWLTGFVTTNRFHMFLRILMVLPILAGGVLGFSIWARNPALVTLLALIILSRTIFFAFYGAEARYIVEAYPPMIAACGVAGAALIHYLNRVWNNPSSRDPVSS